MTRSGHADLKITDIKVYPFDIPLKDIFQIATMQLSTARNVLVQVVTDGGIAGWGEAASFHALVGETQAINFAAAKALKAILIGKNPLGIDALSTAMDRYLPHNTTLKSALDMALHDIAAQAAGLPLYLFLGGEARAMETDLTIGICDPGEAGEKALAIQAQGFRLIKIKLGLDFHDDHVRLANIRNAVGSAPILRIDANQGWDRMAARHHLDAFQHFDIEFCEQPCRADDWRGMRYVNRHSTIPIMADESLFSPVQAMQLVERDVAPYFNIKLSKSGGICNAIKIAHVAEAGAIPCMMGCMSESKLGITAAAHLGMALGTFKFFDLDSFYEHEEDPIHGGVTISNGMIKVPDAPGIGACPDPDYVKTLEEVK